MCMREVYYMILYVFLQVGYNLQHLITTRNIYIYTYILSWYVPTGNGGCSWSFYCHTYYAKGEATLLNWGGFGIWDALPFVCCAVQARLSEEVKPFGQDSHQETCQIRIYIDQTSKSIHGMWPMMCYSFFVYIFLQHRSTQYITG